MKYGIGEIMEARIITYHILKVADKEYLARKVEKNFEEINGILDSESF